MFAPLGEIIRNGIAQTTPSGLFFAIGEQLNALSGLALCLIMAWSHYCERSHRSTCLNERRQQKRITCRGS